MQPALKLIAYAIGLWLNLCVIATLVRGSYRQYPFVFAYAVALLLSTIVEIAVNPFVRSQAYSYYYWSDELLLDILVFCIVIAFIDEAARNSTRTPIERRWLILAAACILAGSLAVHRNPHFNKWMTLVTRDLNICAVIMDLILWSLLVTARRPNRRLMLLSGGLGLQLAGAIMGEQLRNFSHRLFLTGTLLEISTGLLALYIWWRALRTIPVEQA